MFLQIVGVVAVAVSIIPWILIPVLPLLLFFLYLRRYFLRTSRNIKRLESTSECPSVRARLVCAAQPDRNNKLFSAVLPAARSPVFSHLSSSLQGLWTIRAFGAEERFQNAFDAHQDLHSREPLRVLASFFFFF